MEVFAKYGTEAQKKKWLVPLLNGEIRSAFLMTEPQVASSDATNIELTMRKEGNEYVLNGQVRHNNLPRQECPANNLQKWWSSGAGDARCKIYIVMGKSDPSNTDKYKQQSVILVPADTPGVTVQRVLSVIGFDHAPHGHGHITFNNVRVPAEKHDPPSRRGLRGRPRPPRARTHPPRHAIYRRCTSISPATHPLSLRAVLTTSRRKEV